MLDFVSKIVSICYYILMFSISSATFVLAISKLFPRVKCVYKYVRKSDDTDALEVYFINLRSLTVIIDNAKVIYSEGEETLPLDDCVIFSSQNLCCTFRINKLNNTIIKKVEFIDIEGRKYNAKRSHCKR